MPYATCAVCGRPFERRAKTHRHCPEHERHGREHRSPTTRAQDSTYKRNRKDVLGLPCVFCGKPADTADHIVPVSRGGDNSPANLQPACRDCNNSKGDRSAPRRSSIGFG